MDGAPAGSGQSKAKRSQPRSRHYAGGKVYTTWLAKRRECDAVPSVFKSCSWPCAEGQNLPQPVCMMWPQIKSHREPWLLPRRSLFRFSPMRATHHQMNLRAVLQFLVKVEEWQMRLL